MAILGTWAILGTVTLPTSRITPSLTPIGYFLLQLLYIPLVIYVPALAFNQVTGLNLHAIALLVCAVCIFYTTLVREMRNPKESRCLLNSYLAGWPESGGLDRRHSDDRHVRRSTGCRDSRDQSSGWIRSSVEKKSRHWQNRVFWVRELPLRKCLRDQRSFSNGRRFPWNFRIFLIGSMDPDPTARHTFWTVVVGNYLNWLATCSVNQAMVQRCLAMANLKRANV